MEHQVIRGACGHDCPDTCAWQVEVDATGRAVKLQGDAEHPFTRGTLCAKVNHYLDLVYHPRRVLHPLRRVGAKGDGRFERVSWPEALADIAQRWRAIERESGAEAILPYSLAGNQGAIQMASLGERLFGLLGASRLDRNICGEVAAAGLAATQGAGFGVNPEELVHSRFIVLWGTNTLVTNLHLWPVIRTARERGAKVVVVDPVATRTARSADWHIALRPGSDAALALAMMHVIIRDALVDRDYVRDFAHGFAELAAHVRQHSPAAVASQTGLSPEEIERFAREYATTQPSLLRPLIGPEHHRNGAMIFRTMACLPVLTGAWRHRGGGLCRSTGALQYSTLNMQALLRPETQRPGVRTLNMRDLGEDLCSSTLAPAVRALLVYNCNPAVSMPNRNRIRQGLARADLFTVVHDLFVTETAHFADYVLPATSQIEHLDIVPAWGHHYLSMNQPAIAPRGEAVANTELFRRLALALGREEPWLYDTDEALVRQALSSGHPWLDGISFESLQRLGYQHLNHAADWRPYAEGFPTRTGKAELYSDKLREIGLPALPVPGESARGAGLQLISGKALHQMNSSYGASERHQRRAGELTIELHEGDLLVRKLTDGAAVRVFNAYGEVRATCRLSERVRPGVAWMPFGAGAVNAVTPEAPTDWGGGSGLYDAFIEVEALGV